MYLSKQQRALLTAMVRWPLEWHEHMPAVTGVRAQGRRRTMRSLVRAGLVRWHQVGERVIDRSGNTYDVRQGGYAPTIEGRRAVGG